MLCGDLMGRKSAKEGISVNMPWQAGSLLLALPGKPPLVSQQRLLNDCYNPGIIFVSKDTLY